MTDPSPPSVLVIDDTPNNLRVAVELLESHGFTALTARDGERGLRRAPRADLILLDIQMPGIDGYETCRRLKADPATAHIPVIFMTALAGAEDKVRAFEVGGVDYITKPFQLEEMRARVETHLELARLQRALRDQNARLEERVADRTRALRETNAAMSRFVPDAFLRWLGREDILGAQLGDSVRGEYTVMFSDIRGYTTLSEALGPAGVFALLNEYCARMGPLISAHGGYISHFLGDGLMAIFPDAAGAAGAAIAQHRALEAFNGELAAAGRPTLRVGIGLNTGPLTLGVIGDGQRLDVTILGDAVNLAARMEGLTKFYGVRTALSGSTRAALGEGARVRLLDRVRAKGKRAVSEVYELLDADPPALQAQKRALLPRFEAGLAAADAGDFAAASKAFIDALQVLPDDTTARLWLERSARFLLHGRPEGWVMEPPK